jgi:hypothetical protein
MCVCTLCVYELYMCVHSVRVLTLCVYGWQRLQRRGVRYMTRYEACPCMRLC